MARLVLFRIQNGILKNARRKPDKSLCPAYNIAIARFDTIIKVQKINFPKKLGILKRNNNQINRTFKSVNL